MYFLGCLLFLGICLSNVHAVLRYVNRTAPYEPMNNGSCPCRFPNETLNEKDFIDGALCKRPCNGSRRICHFTFYIEDYSTMGLACGNCPFNRTACSNPGCVPGIGLPRSITTINRRMPGPCIEVCKGDIIVVDVVNLFLAETTTIHWHGIFQNNGFQWNDGPPYITQCPISPGTTFRYTFPVVQCGSFWYHSHSGMQRPDGMVGCFIIRCHDESPTLRGSYNIDDNPIILQDFTNVPAEALVAGFTLEKTNLNPDLIFINGKTSCNINGTTGVPFPITVIQVKKGLKYRLRYIAATSYTCSYLVQIEGHPVTLITTDGGNEVTHVNCTTVMLNSAERFDVVLTANHTNGTFYLLVQGADTCSNITSYALLDYQNSTLNFTAVEINSKSRFPINPNIVCNAHFNKTTCVRPRPANQSKDICIIDLNGVCKPPIDFNNKTMCPKTKILIFDIGFVRLTQADFNSRKFDHFFVSGVTPLSFFVPFINFITFQNPTTTLLGTAMYNPPDTFCNSTCMDRSIPKNPLCECTSVSPICLNACTIIILRAKAGGLRHPIHIHGYDVNIIFQESDPKYVTMSDQQLMTLALSNQTKTRCPPVKDVISVIGPGIVIMQFKANNPGYWFIHCHYSFHGELGMATIIKVGTTAQHPMMPKNFPTCRNFKTNCL